MSSWHSPDGRLRGEFHTYPIPWRLTNTVAVLPPFCAPADEEPVRLPVRGTRVVCPRDSQAEEVARW